MKIQLIAIDSKFPNLALMKLSAYHKQLGDTVGFNVPHPDIVYVSVIFSKNVENANGLQRWYPDSKFYIGGPALETPTNIPPEAEHLMPDYSLYPDLDYSVGFTTRGCFRECGFCVVPKLEGPFKEYAPVEEFYNPTFSKMVLMDNNFLASKNRTRTLDFVKEKKLKVCISQGMDARIITSNIAEELSLVDSYNIHFKQRSYIFAWDHVNEETDVLRGINLMLEAGIQPKNIMVYVLVGFDSEYWQDAYRLKTLAELGVTPYVMIYNFKRSDPVLNSMAKWANRRYYTVCKLEDYAPLKKITQTRKVW